MVDSGFTRKKIESLTLGEKLRKFRGELHIPLTEVSRTTRIRLKYLEYLENGEYDKLPADVYVRGFLRNYARFLGVDEAALMKLYDRERNIQKNLGNSTENTAKKIVLPGRSFVVTSRTVTLSISALVLVAVFGYLYQEFRSFASEPRLVILEPASGVVVETSEIVLRGKTDKGARVSVNGEATFVGSEGDFTEKLTLQNGINTVTVVAINRFEKSKTEVLTLEARFTEGDAPNSEELSRRAEDQERFFIEITTQKAVTLNVTADEVVVQNGLLEAAVVRKIEAKEQIVITTSSGSDTLIKNEAGDEEALGPDQKPVNGVVFTREGRQEKEETVE